MTFAHILIVASYILILVIGLAVHKLNKRWETRRDAGWRRYIQEQYPLDDDESLQENPDDEDLAGR